MNKPLIIYHVSTNNISSTILNSQLNFILEENRAIAMGNYFFTDLNGNEAKVEYTFGYQLIDGVLKIDVHHSSFPYKISEPAV